MQRSKTGPYGPLCLYNVGAVADFSASMSTKVKGTTIFGQNVGGLSFCASASLSSSLEKPFNPASAVSYGFLQERSFKKTSLYPAAVYSVAEKPREPLGDTLRKAGKRALGGGIPGAAAMAVQVLTLLPMRTCLNYQYRYGTTTTEAFKTLYSQGFPRFYRGLLPALFQGPLARFGDTAANAGTLALLDSLDSTAGLPVAVKTMAASASAAGFRIFLMPIDACKTIMQVEGQGGFTKLVNKVKIGGPRVLYHGALAASTATFVGHYPWYTTYNVLNEKLPQYDELPKRLMRSAVIGFTASLISDTCSNSIRVVKTYKQASVEETTYPKAIREIIAKDGYIGLFGRGLKTKILANGLQGLMFSVLWRIGQDMYNKREAAAQAAK